MEAYSFWKDYPYGHWRNRQPNSVVDLKEGCLMIEKGIKGLMRKIRVTGFTINIGFIGLNISGGSSKANMPYYEISIIMDKDFIETIK